MTTPTVAEALNYADEYRGIELRSKKCLLVLAAELRAARATVAKQRELLTELRPLTLDTGSCNGQFFTVPSVRTKRIDAALALTPDASTKMP